MCLISINRTFRNWNPPTVGLNPSGIDYQSYLQELKCCKAHAMYLILCTINRTFRNWNGKTREQVILMLCLSIVPSGIEIRKCGIWFGCKPAINRTFRNWNTLRPYFSTLRRLTINRTFRNWNWWACTVFRRLPQLSIVPSGIEIAQKEGALWPCW